MHGACLNDPSTGGARMLPCLTRIWSMFNFNSDVPVLVEVHSNVWKLVEVGGNGWNLKTLWKSTKLVEANRSKYSSSDPVEASFDTSMTLPRKLSPVNFHGSFQLPWKLNLLWKLPQLPWKLSSLPRKLPQFPWNLPPAFPKPSRLT